MNKYAIFILIKINNIRTRLARMIYEKPNRHRETHFNVVRSFVCFFRLKLKNETHLDTRKTLLKIMITILNVIEIFKVTCLELLTDLRNSHATPPRDFERISQEHNRPNNLCLNYGLSVVSWIHLMKASSLYRILHEKRGCLCDVIT